MAMTSEEKEMRKRELQWQAQDDARTLALVQEILNDKARLGRAKKEANKQAKELEKRADAMKKAARKK